MGTGAGRLGGMRGFTLVWVGQLVSLLGTGMTQFALAFWAWEVTGRATALALVGFFAFGPSVLLSPLAGALVDRWDRRRVLVLSDLASGLATVGIALLFFAGRLEIWHLYIAAAFSGAFQAFQFPAYAAAITMMLPKKDYARANGMLELANAASAVAAPLLAGVLLAVIGLGGILAIDIVTFVFAVSVLLFVHIPNPAPRAEQEDARGPSLWRESIYGFRYIWARPSLLGLQLIFLGVNLTATFAFIVLQPMVLARTGNDAAVLGTVLSAGGLGGVAGGLLMSLWGGPKRRIHGVLGGMALGSLFGTMVLGVGQSLPLWAVGMFFTSASIPILNGSNQAIWQSKVAANVQGRVFSVRRLIAQISAPLAMLAAGPAADFVFEPAMQPGGALVPLFGPLVGSGPGAGMSLMILLTGAASVLIALAGYAIPAIRNVETLLPDLTDAPLLGPAADETAALETA